jgi:hypothetical protein
MKTSHVSLPLTSLGRVHVPQNCSVLRLCSGWNQTLLCTLCLTNLYVRASLTRRAYAGVGSSSADAGTASITINANHL